MVVVNDHNRNLRLWPIHVVGEDAEHAVSFFS